jgi:pilus assembly protein FimV
MFPKPPLVIALALLPALVPNPAAALGLGGMRTQSALNQPFYAEIELNDVRPGEIDTVQARLASREEFDKAGAERPHFLTRLQFSPAIGTDGRPYVQVSSREPIREPYMDFLVEVVWPQGTLVKQYTVLLDPPARGRRPPPRVVVPSATAPRREPPPEPQPALRRSPPELPRQEARSVTPPSPAPVPPQARDTRFPIYYSPVPQGATLTRIARELTPPGATMEQTAMALFRNNQDAFMRGNINLLRVGADLVVPTAEELFALDQSTARRQFQDALAGRSVNTSPITDVPSDARLRIAAGETSPTAASAPMPPANADPGLRDDLLNVQATTESNRQETAELRRRILELESHLADIQRLLALRNEELAALRADSQQAEAPLPIPPAPAPVGSSREPSLPQAEPTEVASAEKAPEGTDEAPIVEPGIGLVQADASVEALMPPNGTALPADSGVPPADPDAASAAAAASQLAQAQAVEGSPTEGAGKGAATRAGDEPVWAGTMDSVAGSAAATPPWALGAAVGAVFVGGLGLLAYRRRRQHADDEDMEWVSASIPAEPTAALSDARAQQGFELRSTAAEDRDLHLDLDLDTIPDLASDATPGSRQAAEPEAGIDRKTGLPVGVVTNLPESQQDTQEADVIAEADIYILYGRYREAEALLREQLERSPQHPALKYKLGEALLGSGNRAELAVLLGEMAAAGDDEYNEAKWASLQSGLAGLGADGDDEPIAALAPRVSPLDHGVSRIASEQDALDDGAAHESNLPGDRDHAELGFSVRELASSSADRLPEEIADLDLDLGKMDDFGATTGVATTDEHEDPLIDTDDGPRFEAKGPPSSIGDQAAHSEPPRDLGLGAGPGDDRLDLDLEGLEALAASPTDTGSPHLKLQPLKQPSVDDDGSIGEDAVRHAPDLGALPDPLAVAENGTDDGDEQTAADGRFEERISSDVLSSQWRMDSGLWDEAATKMDLARAYIEMDDPDAARAILEEVVQEGSEAQRADAEALLARIG